jgi:hypothetical protein
MVTFVVLVSRQPVPATPSSLRNLCALCVSALSFSRSCSFNSKLSTVSLSSLTFPLTRMDAKLTRVKHKSFICHSYKKHPGWGTPRHFSAPLPICPSLATTNLFRMIFFARPHPLSPVESYSSQNKGRGRIARQLVSSILPFARQRLPTVGSQ